MFIKIMFGGSFVKSIKTLTKEDLVQAKVHKDLILNTEDQTKFDPETNQWVPFDGVG